MDRVKVFGIVMGGLVAIGLGVAGFRQMTATDAPQAKIGEANTRSSGERSPTDGGSSTGGAYVPLPSTAPPPLDGANNLVASQGGRSVPSPVPPIERLKVPTTREAMTAEKRRVARERAIAEGRLPEFETAEKAREAKAALKKAEREKRREEAKKRREDRRRQVEEAKKAGLNPPPPGRRIESPGSAPAN